MDYFWHAVVSVFVLLIIWAIVANKLKHRRIRKATEKIFPKVDDHIQAHRRYNIFVSHGKTLQNVNFVGVSPAYDMHNPYLPFPLCQWLIVEKPSGARAYLKPASVRYYEDSEEEANNRAEEGAG